MEYIDETWVRAPSRVPGIAGREPETALEPAALGIAREPAAQSDRQSLRVADG
ncbi:hypothetical protein GCM10010497_61030 [Streptomyces cinereoruber]|uniref:Uncharacterized protein n=1 Tax=Streptomyces cinereoruber TaxID=67260 RepID=A0AAV4KTF4_9ACTN|nr:hypothetical protein GCM10010497_61030 [Streptomyces cinereoruber]